MREKGIREKQVLLVSLMRDCRGSFPEGKEDKRVLKILELAKELELNSLHSTLNQLIALGELDGRYFRDIPYNYNHLTKLYNITEKDRVDTKYRSLFDSPEYVKFTGDDLE